MNLLQRASQRLGRKGLAINGHTSSGPWTDAPFWDLQRARYNWQSPTSLAYNEEAIENDFEGYLSGAFKANGPVFSLMLIRLQVFSEARFQFRQLRNGRGGKLFGTPALDLLENPWPGGTTGDLLARIITHADLAGNAYVTKVSDRYGERLRLLRPDWVTIITESASEPESPLGGASLDARIVAYVYEPRVAGNTKPTILLPEQVAHFAPIPDPEFNWRGMSWLTPVLREITADSATTKHKLKFFENAAAQPYDAGMLTPTGWTRMEDIKVGSSVMGPDGKPRLVLGVFPQGEKDIYRLTFEGGATTECCEDHVWQVSNAYDRKVGKHRLMTLREIIDSGVTYPSGTAKWAIPLTDPVEYGSTAPLPIDPYLFGMLLGDGSFRSNGVVRLDGQPGGMVTLSSDTQDADETAAHLGPLLPNGVTLTRRDRERGTARWTEFSFKGAGGTKENPLTRAVRDLGLFNFGGADKSIPEIYMRASVDDRIALLQGLIDSDGSVNGSKSCSTGVRFSSTSEKLALQVRELAQSLGGVAACTPEGRNGMPNRRDQWTVRINRLPEWITPVRLSRKAANYRAFGRDQRIQTLKGVEFVRREQAQCIKVDADDGLYVTEDFIVTHNTPNLSISLDASVKPSAFSEFVEAFLAAHQGSDNAHKPLIIGGGADVKPLTFNFRDLDFKALQGGGETRLASAAGVPPVIVGFSEGLQGSSLNQGNYAAARRRFADGTMRPLWRNIAGSLARLIDVPDNAELWVDERDIAFLREDRKDQAGIVFTLAQTARHLLETGCKPESVFEFMASGDPTVLEHTGVLSVQLQDMTPAPDAGPDEQPIEPATEQSE